MVMSYKNVLVVGGAGYIGSHMVRILEAYADMIVVIDNCSTGHKESLCLNDRVIFFEIDIGDEGRLNQIFKSYSIDAVIHFGANSLVSESVKDPKKYYINNVVSTLSLLNVMIQHDVKSLVFSSTAAIFGNPKYSPIDESHPKAPINPYGQSKYMVECILQDYAKAYGLNSVCLRYFNAAGALESGGLGERHDPETHLIPLVLQVASKRREKIYVYGSDYQTKDGTCVRDYIHVEDLCDAHLCALNYLSENAGAWGFNLGNGKGYSVKEVIDIVSEVTKEEVVSERAPRREGDPDVLVADSSRAKTVLGWEPKKTSLQTIVEHAWAWERDYLSK